EIEHEATGQPEIGLGSGTVRPRHHVDGIAGRHVVPAVRAPARAALAAVAGPLAVALAVLPVALAVSPGAAIAAVPVAVPIPAPAPTAEDGDARAHPRGGRRVRCR